MAPQKSCRVIISGGGTGGHVYPGIAIANKIKELQPEAEIMFVGVKKRIEEKIVPREGYPLHTIHVQYLPRRPGLRTLTFFSSLVIGLLQSLWFLKRYQPRVVVGTGGYVSGPVVYAAHLLGTPTLIQEQNSYPGITTRLLAGRATEVHLAFAEALAYFRKIKDQTKFKITGNPIRLATVLPPRGVARHQFGLAEDQRTLFLFGGSQGATALNKALQEALPYLSSEIQIIWQTGEADFDAAKNACSASAQRIFVAPFIYNMLDAYAAADLALCRAGAITIAELVQLGIPAIFVPLPTAAEGHQEKNARVLVEAQAAAMILQQDLTGKSLQQTIEALIFDEPKLQLFRQNLKPFHHPNAAEAIAQRVLALAQIPVTIA
ncbi:MAG: undecaprenyldiphospho-muramoylpentapeptide beta-N-acetylglucosaminyltransferase [candidate division KSB1 bacterium]|nr:undecaprenyldiphospho-muramoylpentapeptide beta-N-acetylglucosaminyltransferase [candidate division KSB1 bacterium]